MLPQRLQILATMKYLAIPFILSSLTFACLWLVVRARLARVRACLDKLNAANKDLIHATIEQARICAVLRRELQALRMAPLAQWESAHFVGDGEPSATVRALRTFAPQVGGEEN